MEESNADAKPVSFSTADGKKVEFKAKAKPRPKKSRWWRRPWSLPSQRAPSPASQSRANQSSQSRMNSSPQLCP